jgi:hypothetical protein
MDPTLRKSIKKGINDFGENFQDNKFVMQFIPIFLVLFYSLYKDWFIETSRSVLGKLFSIIIIIFYTKMNKLYGVFVCVAFILFYQLTEQDVVEGMKSKKRSKKSKPVTTSSKPVTTSNEDIESSNSDEVSPPPSASKQIVAASPKPIVSTAAAASVVASGTNNKEEPDTDLPDTDLPDTDLPETDAEGFENYQSLYPVISKEDFNTAKDEFIKEKCKNGIIMYKDMPVKPEMVDHIFSEINFTTKTKCNPCDRTCAYSIIESKLEIEEALGKPKHSNDFFDYFKSFFEPKRDEWKEPKSYTTVKY